MQLKQLTAFAASLALAQASYNGTNWSDETKSPVLDTTTTSASVPSKPVDGGHGIPSKPVDGGSSTKVADTTASTTTGWPSKPVDGGSSTKVADTTASTTTTVPYWGDESMPVDGGSSTKVADSTASTTTGWPSKPVDGGETSSTSVADTTASTTSTVSWGDHASFPVTEETTTEEITKTFTKPDGSESTTTETNTKTITKTITVGGGAGGPPASTPVSGDEGGAPGGGAGHPGAPGGGAGAPPANTPVSGGQGGGPGAPGGGFGGPGAPGGGECGTVTVTTTNVITVTVPAGGHGGPPAATTPVIETSTSEFSMTWQDQSTGFQTSSAAAAPSAPAQGGYMGVIAEWRQKMGLSALEEDNTLQSNAQNAADSSGGQLKHKLNPGSMAQVMAPGDSSNFEDVFVGGWLCELPNTPGLGSGVCDEFSKGWNYEGQTGHAEILTSGKYSKIGCGLGDGIWCCDLA